MRSTYPKIFLPALLAAAVCLAVLPGCGGPAYEAKLNARLDQLRAGAPFRSLFAPARIADTPVTIRIPMAFRDSYTHESGHKDDGGRIRPDRLQPPFLTLPGLKLCYEGTITDAAEGKLPFYCYLAVVPQGDAGAIATELQAKLKETFKDTPEQWQNVDAKTPDDKALSWRTIRVTGDQPFRIEGQPEPKKLPGTFELWIRDADGYVVLVGWRTPTSIEGKAAAPTDPQNALMQLTAEVKPDLESMPALTAGTLKIEAPKEASG